MGALKDVAPNGPCFWTLSYFSTTVNNFRHFG
uniref:Uncharacterized protein n=1 Tax=Anguilla anguilla TaxID=7936 RepID=A0A0E9UAY2_ANGAN